MQEFFDLISNDNLHRNYYHSSGSYSICYECPFDDSLVILKSHRRVSNIFSKLISISVLEKLSGKEFIISLYLKNKYAYFLLKKLDLSPTTNSHKEVERFEDDYLDCAKFFCEKFKIKGDDFDCLDSHEDNICSIDGRLYNFDAFCVSFDDKKGYKRVVERFCKYWMIEYKIED